MGREGGSEREGRVGARGSSLSQWENFKLACLPLLFLTSKFELFVPWCLENRVREVGGDEIQ